VGHRHQPFGEAIASLALRAERALAPQHEGPQLSLGVVVGRLDAFVLGEGPQRRLVLEDVGAAPASSRSSIKDAGRHPRDTSDCR
jgi:hypothetical protein